MTLPEAAIRRPVATVLLTLALVIAGWTGWGLLPVAALPNVDFPTIQISASLPGANPDTMASAVATPIERQLATISGIDSILSSSSVGTTSITVQFALDRDIDAAALDVQSALSVVQRKLPPQMTTPPSFQKVNPADQPILLIGVTSDAVKLSALQDILDTQIIPRIATTSGVSQVNVFGSKTYAVRVRFDPDALAARSLTTDDLRQALATANSNTPVGSIGEGSTFYVLDATGNLQDAADFAEVVVAWRNGQPIRVKDVATVEDSVANRFLQASVGGQPSLIMAIQKQPGANVVGVVDAITAELPKLKAALPADATLRVIIDRSASVRAANNDAQLTLLGTAVLVVIVIFLVLGDGRATLVPAIVLPVAGMGTFAGMWLLGFSLDNISLLALTLAAGFVVDDAIVVLENIVRKIEHGLTPFRAAIEGASEIFYTVISISVSLVAVFIPLLFMGGVIGRLFHEFAVTLTVAIGVSVIVSLTLTPLMASRLLAPRDAARKPTLIARWSTAGFDRFTRGYAWALDRVLARPALTLGATVLSIGLTLWGFGAIPKGFFPTEDTGLMTITTQAAPDISFTGMVEKQSALAEIVRADPAVAVVTSIVGVTGSSGSLNNGRMFVGLKPEGERDSGFVVQARLRKALAAVPGIQAFPQIQQNLTIGARAGAAQYQYTLSGIDTATLYDFAPKLEARLRTTPGFSDVLSDLQLGSREARLIIDRDAASRAGVSVDAIRQALYDSFGQEQISTIYTSSNSYQVIQESALSDQIDPASIDKIQVRASDNTLVPLSALATIEIRPAPVSLSHQSELPAVTISFNLTGGASLSDAETAIAAAMDELKPAEGIAGSFQGSAQAYQQSASGELTLFLAAILVIYVVLGVLYESFIHPITILAGLPSAAIGALLALWLFGMPLDVIGIIGIVLLIGIVKKNAIMMIDFALHAMRNEGMDARAAARHACLVRFRPIMMTTFAALASALPIAFGLGAGGELRQPLGVVVAGGLLLSQVVTLFITPVIFVGFEHLLHRTKQQPVDPMQAAEPTPAA
ncbi:Multidrug resistance protein MdtC [Alphaproteobacteria bacterium SO-S41]|nr:Multidrug resistance protein MdtC [Alphaproteobacteria bacterium SO-S41]